MINNHSQPARPLSDIDIDASPSNLAEGVYTALKSDIRKGVLPPGTLLSESALGARFGVSRTPVREALSALAIDGLVTTLPRRGHVVNTVSMAETLDAFRLREVLETEAVAQAARRITADDVARLRRLIETRQADDLAAVNREFHSGIARISGNRLLVDFIDRLLVCMERVLIMDPHTTTWTSDGYEEELAIVEALASHDERAAQEAVVRHIRSTLASVLRQSSVEFLPERPTLDRAAVECAAVPA